MRKARRLTVLVVDDYEDALSLLGRWLRSLDHRVAEARDGREAIEAAQRERPDLILMDLFLPEVDGFTAAARIRELEGMREVPIIAISAYGELGIDVELRHDPTAVGFDAYVPKPFTIGQLAEMIERFCGPGETDGRKQDPARPESEWPD